jgi:uncharacterized protein
MRLTSEQVSELQSQAAGSRGERPVAHAPITPRSHPQDERIVSALRTHLPDMQALYRYGSAGGAYARPESDIDLAVLAGHRLTPDETIHLATQLTQITAQEVDFHDLRSLPVTLRVQIVVDGARLYAASAAAAEEFESRTLSDYVRLNEQRRGILQDVRERGRIHG